jgi:hypothetical protein
MKIAATASSETREQDVNINDFASSEGILNFTQPSSVPSEQGDLRRIEMTNRKLPTAEQIERRAYELYLERGGEEGRDVDDWLAAEKELTELPEQSTSSTPRARAATPRP